MKKKTKVNKKRLDSLLLVLLLTAALMIMSTYAWFTSNRTVTIGSIDVHVATSAGLQISADGKTWKTDLDISDIRTGYTGHDNQLADDIEPVSTALKETYGKLEMYWGDVQQNPSNSKYYLTAKKQTDQAGNEGKYVAFDIFLRSGNSEPNLYMVGDINEVKKLEASDGSTTYQKVDADAERGIANAARVAIIKGGHTEDADKQPSVLALDTVGGNVYMWEPNYDKHTEKGIEYATKMLGWLDDSGVRIGSSERYVEGRNNPYFPYAGVNSEVSSILLSEAKDGTAGFQKVNPTWITKYGTEHSLKIPPVTVGSDSFGILNGATRYRVYMWVEGQDIDCENNASGTYLQFDLKFSLDDNTTGGVVEPVTP